MEKILFLAPTEENGTLSKGALEALGAALQAAKLLEGSTLSVGLWGANVEAAAGAIAGCGAESFHTVSGEEFAASRYASDAAAAETLVRAAEATLVIAPTSSRTSRTLPGVAARTHGRIDTHVAGIQAGAEGLHINRWYYRQRMAATLSRSQRPWILVVSPGVFQAWSGEAGTATVNALTVDIPQSARRTRVEGTRAAVADAQTIRPDADLLFVAGAGWTKKQADGETHIDQAEKLILSFLDGSQASLGGSKSLVEQGGEGHAVLSFMTHMNQVGQTGTTPRHQKGLSTCCHGEEPHVIGWRFIKERRAINKDASCGWARGKTDVLYVADAFEVMARVNELLDPENSVSTPGFEGEKR